MKTVRRSSRVIVVVSNIVLSVIGLGVVGAGVEAYYRAFVPPLEVVGGRYLPHDTLNHVFAPDYDTTLRVHPEVPAYAFRSNEIGMRVAEPFALQKPPATWRILVCGDSFIEGYAWEYSIPFLLEAALRAEVEARGFRLEVLNAGVASYSPMLHFFSLRERLLALEPDAVLLAIDLTDAHDDMLRYAPLLVTTPSGKPVGVRSRMAERKEDLRLTLLEHASIFHHDYWIALGTPYLYAARSMFDARAFAYVRQFEGYLDPELKWRPEYYDSTRAAVRQSIEYSQGWIASIHELLAEHSIPVLLAMYPHRPVLETPRLRSYIEGYARFARERGLPMHDATEAFARVGRPEELFLSHNIHFNAAGQQLWAASLLPDVRGQLLPEPR